MLEGLDKLGYLIAPSTTLIQTDSRRENYAGLDLSEEVLDDLPLFWKE